jgi:hypothetical protein
MCELSGKISSVTLPQNVKFKTIFAEFNKDVYNK